MVGARKMIAFFDDCTIGTQGRNKQHTARKDKRGLEEFSVFVGDFEGGGGFRRTFISFVSSRGSSLDIVTDLKSQTETGRGGRGGTKGLRPNFFQRLRPCLFVNGYY